MSKLFNALEKVEAERFQVISPSREKGNFRNNYKMGGKMRKSWLTWVFIVAIVAVFFVFNYQEGKDAVPLSEIFPEEEVFPVNVEYEFVQAETVSQEAKEMQTVSKEVQAAPVGEKTTQSSAAVESKPAEKLTASYTIQIASFKDKKRAEEALASIRAKVPSAYIASRDLGSKGIWYRIYAGQFNVRNEAEVSLNDIRQNYDSSFIISPNRAK